MVYDVLMSALLEYRCPECHKLLFKGALVGGAVEIKCGRCNALRTIEGTNEEILLCFKEECPNRVKRSPLLAQESREGP